MVNSELDINILSWNVWSISNETKLIDTLQILEDNDIHIACICETWFDCEKSKLTAIIGDAGFNIQHSFREVKRGGGTAIIYKKDLKIKKGSASSQKYQSFEFTYIHFKLTSDSRKITLLCLYRKQEISCKTFCEELEDLMDFLNDISECLIVLGDFNIWIDIENNQEAKLITTLMSAYGLSQMIF